MDEAYDESGHGFALGLAHVRNMCYKPIGKFVEHWDSPSWFLSGIISREDPNFLLKPWEIES